MKIPLFLLATATALAADTPEVLVSNIRRAFHNGEHNAFTGLVRFRDRFYLTFRSCPDGHGVFPSASIIVLASDDAQNWEQVHRFSVAQRDTRDPHFLVFQEKLFVYTGTWFCREEDRGNDVNEHLGYAVWSGDGKAWEGPRQLEGTYGHYVWRAAAFEGRAYLCGRRKRGHVSSGKGREGLESAMLESEDGLIWRFRALFQETEGNETAFLFEPDGSLLAVARRTGTAEICRSKPPYGDWERRDLNRFIGGPLLVKWGDRYVVAGRKTTEDTGPKTSFDWLVNGELREFAELPSAGDNSYPGFIELSPTKALISWYSSHERDAEGKTITAIYLADFALQN